MTERYFMKRSWAFKCYMAILTVLLAAHSAFAIGMWVPGNVAKSPWYSDFHYMVVDKVKYIIMEEAFAREVVEKNGVVDKSVIDIKDIRLGDKVLILAEGNRIYQIEILR